MDPFIINIQLIHSVTHDVLQIKTDKPGNLHFHPGQAAEITINKPGWENEKRPFTFTSLPEDSHVEFVIKTYPEHKSVTNELLLLHPNDQLKIHDIFGSIQYKGEGLFIAGGAGITPFISILRDLKAKNAIGNNKLIFANKTEDDIILKDELTELLEKNFINILSEEKSTHYQAGYITKELLLIHIDTNKLIYLCGPPPMMKAIEKHLTELNIPETSIIKETF